MKKVYVVTFGIDYEGESIEMICLDVQTAIEYVNNYILEIGLEFKQIEPKMPCPLIWNRVWDSGNLKSSIDYIHINKYELK